MCSAEDGGSERAERGDGLRIERCADVNQRAGCNVLPGCNESSAPANRCARAEAGARRPVPRVVLGAEWECRKTQGEERDRKCGESCANTHGDGGERG